jgi:hypothetical protein
LVFSWLGLARLAALPLNAFSVCSCSLRERSQSRLFICRSADKVKSVSPTRADGDTQGLLALRANRPFVYTCTLRACRASFFWQSSQKKPKGLLPGDLAGCAGPRDRSGWNGWSCLNSRATPPLQGFLRYAQTALAFSAALRSDRHAHKDSVPPGAPPASVKGRKNQDSASLRSRRQQEKCVLILHSSRAKRWPEPCISCPGHSSSSVGQNGGLLDMPV